MKEPEYREGPEALEHFKEGMKALFKVPKDSVVKAEKRKRRGRGRGITVCERWLKFLEDFHRYN